MTKGQKDNIARLKRVQAEAKKLKAKNPKLSHIEAVKKASAMISLGSAKKKAPVKKKIGKVTLKKANYFKNDDRYVIMNDGVKHLDGKPFFKERAQDIAKSLRKVKSKLKAPVKKIGAIKKKAPVKRKQDVYFIYRTYKNKSGKVVTQEHFKTNNYNTALEVLKDDKLDYPSVTFKLTKNKQSISKVGAVKKKAPAKKKVATDRHKDTASHNVKISVMSGIISKTYAMEQYHKELKLITYIEKVISDNIVNTKNAKNDLYKRVFKRELTYLKKMLAEHKTHARELKKLL